MSDIVEQLEAWIRPAGTNVDLPFYREAINEIKQLRDKVRNLTKLLDDQVGTPCEQIRHQQEIEQLRAALEAVLKGVQWDEKPGHINGLKTMILHALENARKK